MKYLPTPISCKLLHALKADLDRGIQLLEVQFNRSIYKGLRGFLCAIDIEWPIAEYKKSKVLDMWNWVNNENLTYSSKVFLSFPFKNTSIL